MENIWKTKDFYSAVVIRASGNPLHSLENINSKESNFVFQSSPEECEELLRKHWDRKLKLPTRDMIESINELKTRIYQH